MVEGEEEAIGAVDADIPEGWVSSTLLLDRCRSVEGSSSAVEEARGGVKAEGDGPSVHSSGAPVIIWSDPPIEETCGGEGVMVLLGASEISVGQCA